MLKDYVQKKIEKLTRKYLETHQDIKLVCVAGSVGKTSTKLAIATILSQQYRVRMHEGNHNTELSAPLAIMDIPYPDNPRSFFAWHKVFKQAKKRIAEPSTVDVIIQELGADRPGDIQSFGRYLQPDIGVVTAVTPEHMENFGTIDAVAQEELSLANFSKIAIINRYDIDGRFAQFLTNTTIDTYGTSDVAEYSFESQDFSLENGHTGVFRTPEFGDSLKATVKVVGEHNIRPIAGAVAVAARFGMAPEVIVAGIEMVRPAPGRMNMLHGMKDSIILDDTYNASPAAVEAAIQTVAGFAAPQKIAILGSMNELGATSPAEHDKIGRLCRPEVFDWVVTIGDEAARYIAPAAQANGCLVRSFSDAISAGSFVHSKLEMGAVVLAKGSEGGIFAEEAVKVILRSTSDTKQLVRQEPAWLEAKTQFFSKF
ncbi:MAG: Mur ligase family protein [Candidatus Saccharimonadales bacterium]